MSCVQEIGVINNKVENGQTQVEWTIADFSALMIDKNVKAFESPKITFQSDSWNITIQPHKPEYLDVFMLYLRSSKSRSYSVEYNFGLKHVDGRMKFLGNDIMLGTKSYSIPLTLKVSDVLPDKTVGASSAVHVTCTLKVIDSSNQPSTVDKSKEKKLIKLNTLSEDFKNLFSNKESYDTVLYVKDKEYKAHRAVLIARSPVFASMFQHETSEKQTGIVNICDCDPDSFEKFLEFLYCGKLEKLAADSALHLYETSDKYDVQELMGFSVECLIENLTAENLCDVVMIANKYDDSSLLSAAQYFFNKNLSKILVTPEWEHLVKTNFRLANKLLIEMSKMKPGDETSK